MITVATLHMFYFTDFLPDPELQYIAGWSMIATIGFILCINMYFVGGVISKQIKLLCMYYANYYERHCKRSKKEEKELTVEE